MLSQHLNSLQLYKHLKTFQSVVFLIFNNKDIELQLLNENYRVSVHILNCINDENQPYKG